ncbi:hypothetical protein CMI37_26045 [Candidatus Pacearchaeota archaeon]|nr:hypothetical protein [Candidatus Pacearchaeota archaeon]
MKHSLIDVEKDESKQLRQVQFFETITSATDEYSVYLERLDSKKLARVKRSVSAIKSGVHASAPLICLGPEKCPFVKRCPIPDISDSGELSFGELSQYPIGRECIMEKFFVEQKIIDYLQHLDVDPNNPVEMSIVNELALIDLYKNRSLMVLSQGDKRGDGRDFMMTDVTGFNENGDRAEITKLHPVVEMIDKLEKRREKWLDKLMQTRKTKAEFMLKMGDSNNNSRVLEEISRLREALYSIEAPEGAKEILLDEE